MSRFEFFVESPDLTRATLCLFNQFPFEQYVPASPLPHSVSIARMLTSRSIQIFQVSMGFALTVAALMYTFLVGRGFGKGLKEICESRLLLSSMAENDTSIIFPAFSLQIQPPPFFARRRLIFPLIESRVLAA